MKKSTLDEIRERFDNDVERFSNLETGQKAVIDSSLQMDLIVSSVSYVNQDAKKIRHRMWCRKLYNQSTTKNT